jgi:hypothetical protein
VLPYPQRSGGSKPLPPWAAHPECSTSNRGGYEFAKVSWCVSLFNVSHLWWCVLCCRNLIHLLWHVRDEPCPEWLALSWFSHVSNVEFVSTCGLEGPKSVSGRVRVGKLGQAGQPRSGAWTRRPIYLRRDAGMGFLQSHRFLQKY